MKERRAAGLASVLALAFACGPTPEPERAPERSREPIIVPEQALVEFELAGAALVGSVETTALARLARALPRPSLTGSPLVAGFSAIVEQLSDSSHEADANHAALDRLAWIGLAHDARIELSVRPLDDRRAAVRKRIAELAALTPEQRKPEALLELHEQAASLGLHLRALLPSDEPERLAQVLALIVGATPSDPWRSVCTELGDPRTCGGRERLLVWTRPHPRGLRVDAIYLFHAPPSESKRTWISEVAGHADARVGRAAGVGTHAIELGLDAEASKAVLHTEATADAALAVVRGELDEHALLDREQAFDDLLATERVFTGLELRGTIGEDDDPSVELELGWTLAPQAGPRVAELASPSPLVLPAPEREPLCKDALACMQLEGISRAPRFAPFATGPYAHSTTIQRVLRQAGDRGWILVELATWPNLIGTIGELASSGQGVAGRAVGSLTSETSGVGAALLELGAAADPNQDRDRWVAWIRAETRLVELLEPFAELAGIELRPGEIAGVKVLGGEGALDDYPRFELATSKQGEDAWILLGDDRVRIGWALGLPRRADEQSIFYLRMRELGRIGAREQVSFSADPPVHRWLQSRVVEVEGAFEIAGPRVRISLRPG